MTIAEVEPTIVTAGDTLIWKRSLADYVAPTWVLTYALINSLNKINITATNSGGDHLVTVAAATSATYAAGTYRWQSYVTSGSERHNIGTGEIVVKQNFAAESTIDTRSEAKTILDAINAVIAKRATLDQEEYTISGRSLKRTPIADLIVLRDKYAAIYKSEQAAEQLAQGKFGKNKILVRI